MPPFIPLNDSQILSGVRKLVGQDKIAYTRHAEERMRERGIDRSTVKKCLAKGHFAEVPVIPNTSGNIEYQFKLHAIIDGDPVEVVAKLIPEVRTVVITVIDPDS